MPSPDFGNADSYLTAVAAVSPNDIWAVGYFEDEGEGSDRTLIVRWDGSQWSIVPSPNAGDEDNYLRAITIVSPADVWAVGDYEVETPAESHALALHWNGTEWSAAPTPDVGYNVHLNGVAAASADDLWAVGDYQTTLLATSSALTLRWQGSSWQQVPNPMRDERASLSAVVALSPGNAWAVGKTYTNRLVPLIMHWDGSSWKAAKTPNLVGNTASLRGITAVSANDIWTVGYYYNNDIFYQTVVEHWNGSAWSIVPSRNPSDHLDYKLYGITAVSANDLWAVGLQMTAGYRPMVQRFNDPCLAK